MNYMEQAENSAKLMGYGSLVAGLSSLTGYITADAVIPTIGVVVALAMGIASAVKTLNDTTQKWALERKDRYIRDLEQENDREREAAEKERARLEARIDLLLTIQRAWK